MTNRASHIARSLRSHSGQTLILALLALGLVYGACALMTGGGTGTPLSKEELRTPEGFAEWEHDFLNLNWEMLAARRRYVREKSLNALRAYELASQQCFDHGLVLYRAYEPSDRASVPDEEAMVTLEAVSPYLHFIGSQLMDIAQAYVKQGNVAAGTDLARQLLTHYPDLSLRSPRLRAEGLLTQHGHQRDF